MRLISSKKELNELKQRLNIIKSNTYSIANFLHIECGDEIDCLTRIANWIERVYSNKQRHTSNVDKKIEVEEIEESYFVKLPKEKIEHLYTVYERLSEFHKLIFKTICAGYRRFSTIKEITTKFNKKVKENEIESIFRELVLRRASSCNLGFVTYSFTLL